MSTDPLALPDHTEWLYQSARNGTERLSLRYYLEGTGQDDTASGLTTADAAAGRAFVAGIEPYDHHGTVRAAMRSWQTAPETRQVRRALLHLLRNESPPLGSVATASALSERLLQAQPWGTAGNRPNVEAMVRAAIDTEGTSAWPELWTRRTGEQDLVVAASQAPLTDDCGQAPESVVAAAASAIALGAAMFPDAHAARSRPWTPQWPPLSAARLRALIGWRDPELSAVFEQTDPHLPIGLERRLNDLTPLTPAPAVTALASLVAAGSPRAAYNTAADVLYDTQLSAAEAIAHVLGPDAAAIKRWASGASPSVLAEQLETAVTTVFDAAPHLVGASDFAQTVARIQGTASTPPGEGRSATAPPRRRTGPGSGAFRRRR